MESLITGVRIPPSRRNYSAILTQRNADMNVSCKFSPGSFGAEPRASGARLGSKNILYPPFPRPRGS